MKILFVSQYYPPESNAPANRVSALAAYWCSWGHDVTVLTGYPNHPEGRIYPGYRAGRLTVESNGGVRLVRVPIYAAANRGVIRRSIAYSSFCLSASALGPLAVDRPDIVVATSPQLLAAVAGNAIACALGRPFVLEIRDLWPDSIAAVGALREGSPGMRVLRQIEKRLYRSAKHLVVVTESFREILASRGIAYPRISVIPNGVDAELFTSETSKEDPIGERDAYPGRFIACFAGTIGMAHGLRTVLDAARILSTHREILFLIVGEGAERVALQEQARRSGLDNIVFTGRVPRDAIPGLLRRADVSLVVLRDSPLFRSVLPSKIFESMGCGRPILLGVDGEARRLVESAGAGVFFPPGDAHALVRALLEMKASPDRRSEMGRRGRDFVAMHYDRKVLARRYLDVLEDVAFAHNR